MLSSSTTSRFRGPELFYHVESLGSGRESGELSEVGAFRQSLGSGKDLIFGTDASIFPAEIYRALEIVSESKFWHICTPDDQKLWFYTLICQCRGEITCLSGGTGRRARLKIVYRKVCRFDSGLRYESS
jgi:hypothetical protein